MIDIRLEGRKGERFRQIKHRLRNYQGEEPADDEVLAVLMACYVDTDTRPHGSTG